MTIADPRDAAVFRFVRREFADAELRLVYAFDDGPELVERLVFPDARLPPPERAAAFEAALDLLHAIAGISYYKAGVPPDLKFDTRAPSAPTAAFLDALYLHGLGEFAYQNRLDLRGRIRFPSRAGPETAAAALGLPRRTLVPIGAGKDSLVSVEILKAAGEPASATWIGNSPLIEACAQRTGLPMLNIARTI